MKKTVSSLIGVNNTKEYVSPEIEIVEVIVEHGFALSVKPGLSSESEGEYDYVEE